MLSLMVVCVAAQCPQSCNNCQLYLVCLIYSSPCAVMKRSVCNARGQMTPLVVRQLVKRRMWA